MIALTTQDALDQLLEGHTLSPESLDDFVLRFQEDQYLDYKDGAITSKDKREQAKKVIREYVSAFANSDGGILIVGVTDRQPREISPCSVIGNESIDRWAEALLRDIAPRLSPPPRIYVVDHSKGPVLVIAVARAGELIPCVEARQFKYFLRINQSTIEVPPYLISDLVLGRRQHPIVELTAKAEQPPPLAKQNEFGIRIDFLAENIGLVMAEQLAVGVVAWVVGPEGDGINTHLLSYIDLAEVTASDFNWSLRHHTAQPRAPEITRLPPFGRVLFEPLPNLVCPFTERSLEIVAAVYLLSKNSPPLWFELSFRCERISQGVVGSSRAIISELEVNRVVGRRPRVSYAFVD